MTLVITSACVDVKDGICTTSCPVDCIYEGERMYYIHPTECIECGMCESICPVEELPFVTLNDLAFRDADGALMEPGGWKPSDAPIADPPALSTIPLPEKETT